MGLHYLLLGLMVSLLPLQANAGRASYVATADAPGSRLPKTVSKVPEVALAAFLLSLEQSGRLEIFAVTSERLVPVTPETIEGHYSCKIVLDPIAASAMQRDLVRALETSVIEQVNEAPDVCNLAVIGYSAKGERILSMYFAGPNRGTINGIPVVMNGDVVGVLWSRCGPLWQ